MFIATLLAVAFGAGVASALIVAFIWDFVS